MISLHGHVRARPPVGATDTGGQVVYVLELSRKLAQLGHEVDIWTRGFDGLPSEEAVAPGVRILREPCGPAGFVPKEKMAALIPDWCRNALARIEREGLRYRFLNSHYWDAGLAGLALGETLRVPHFHTPHSLGEAKRRQMEAAGANLEPYRFGERIPAERRIGAGCDRLVATTHEMAAMLEADYGVAPERVQVIPPGYDDAAFYPVGAATRQLLRKRLGFEGTVYFALGRLARTKGFDLLIRGFAVAAQRIPDAQLLLAVGASGQTPGQAAMADELRALAAECGVADRVKLLGHIPHRETPDYYRAADVFVLSSRVEPFGMTAIEAMACGTPTIVTVHGGLHQALTFGRNALFADPLDAEDLGIMMTKPPRHEGLRSRLSRMGAHRVRSLFTWTGIAQQLLRMTGEEESDLEIEEEAWDQPWTATS